MLILIVKLAEYFVIGFVEMFLATQRTYWISKGKSLGAALLVFFENFIAFYVIYKISNSFTSEWPLFIFYALGNALGTYVNLEKCPY
jgi:hypothetical protein